MTYRFKSDFVVEAVSRYKPASDAFTSNTPKNYGGGARLILISVPRVRWLERPEINIEPRKKHAAQTEA